MADDCSQMEGIRREQKELMRANDMMKKIQR